MFIHNFKQNIMEEDHTLWKRCYTFYCEGPDGGSSVCLEMIVCNRKCNVEHMSVML